MELSQIIIKILLIIVGIITIILAKKEISDIQQGKTQSSLNLFMIGLSLCLGIFAIVFGVVA